MADTDSHTLMDVMVTTLESDLLMLNPTMVMEVIMVDMVATDMVVMEDTTEESDPLRLSHTMDMVATTATAADTDTVDTVMDVKMDKKLSMQSLNNDV